MPVDELHVGEDQQLLWLELHHHSPSLLGSGVAGRHQGAPQQALP